MQRHRIWYFLIFSICPLYFPVIILLDTTDNLQSTELDEVIH